MHVSLQTTLRRLSKGESLSRGEMEIAMDAIMGGSCLEAEVAELLVLLNDKGENADELAGAAASLRRHAVPIRTQRTALIDTCGTGGDGSATFNISTAAAIVCAAAGLAVAKHGNRSVSSKSGSADVLAELGINIAAGVPVVEACLEELGICFCFAQNLHPAMRHVAPIRKKLGRPTIFNLLGPLSNPAGAPYQLLGVGKPGLLMTMAQVLKKLGTKRATVVCGEDGLDEITIAGATRAIEVTPDGLREYQIMPADFRISKGSLDTLRVTGPSHSADIIRHVLVGEPSVARNIVILNAAAALFTAGVGRNPAECTDLATEAIDHGKARDLLVRWGRRSHQKA